VYLADVCRYILSCIYPQCILGWYKFFLVGREVLLLDPRAKKTLLTLFLKTNSRFSFCLTIFVKKLQTTIELYNDLNLLLQQLVSVHYFFKFFRVKDINQLAVTSTELTSNFAGLVTSGFVSDVPCGPQVEPCRTHHTVLWII
jgi:hypothetical protein